jgi:hypothetical protein
MEGENRLKLYWQMPSVTAWSLSPPRSARRRHPLFSEAGSEAESRAPRLRARGPTLGVTGIPSPEARSARTLELGQTKDATGYEVITFEDQAVVTGRYSMKLTLGQSTGGGMPTDRIFALVSDPEMDAVEPDVGSAVREVREAEHRHERQRPRALALRYHLDGHVADVGPHCRALPAASVLPEDVEHLEPVARRERLRRRVGDHAGYAVDGLGVGGILGGGPSCEGEDGERGGGGHGVLQVGRAGREAQPLKRAARGKELLRRAALSPRLRRRLSDPLCAPPGRTPAARPPRLAPPSVPRSAKPGRALLVGLHPSASCGRLELRPAPRGHLCLSTSMRWRCVSGSSRVAPGENQSQKALLVDTGWPFWSKLMLQVGVAEPETHAPAPRVWTVIRTVAAQFRCTRSAP